MEALLEFVNTNYVAFIVGGVVILLAIIGLIGEKMKKKKGKETVAEVVEETPVTPVVETAVATESLFGATAAADNTQFNLYGSPTNEPKIEESMFGTVTETPADTTFQYNGYEPQSLGEQPVVEATPVEEIPADLFTPLETTTSMPTVEETPVETFTPVAETPVVEMPVVEELTPVVETPVVEMPTVETFTPVAKTPVVEMPSEPVVTETDTDTENRF